MALKEVCVLAKVRITSKQLSECVRQQAGYRHKAGIYINYEMMPLNGQIINVEQYFDDRWQGKGWRWLQEWLDFDLTPEEVKSYARKGKSD